MNIRRLLNVVAALALVVVFMGQVSAQANQTLYVTADGKGACTSWDDSCQLSEALNAAENGDRIFVAEGTYYPPVDIEQPNYGPTFRLPNGKNLEIYGGFPAPAPVVIGFLPQSGFEGQETEFRSVRTIERSGQPISNPFRVFKSLAGVSMNAADDELAQRDWVAHPTILNGDQGEFGRAYHVLFGTDLNNEIWLDGFIVTGGDATGNPDILRQTAGGGLMLEGSRTVHLRNMVFFNNQAETGGAIYTINSQLNMVNVVFLNNNATGCGGALAASETVIGGSGKVTITNATFTGNADNECGTILNVSTSIEVQNSILWDNAIDRLVEEQGQLGPQPTSVVECSIISGEYVGGKNDYQDPRFTDPKAFWLTLSRGSPAIDAGCDSFVKDPLVDTDILGNPRIFGKAVDRGAHEYSPIIYVDSTAEGANTGFSWKDAHTDLQDALARAESGEQIWVAGGTYAPFSGSGGDADATFQLKSGVAVYGGFAGVENNLAERDIAANSTTLQGDCGVFGEFDTQTCSHVVTGSGTDSSAVLDGFLITGGRATEQSGGGMLNVNGSPTVRNVVFENNTAQFGGGMYNNGSSPALINVIFRSNTADDYGGGLANDSTSSPILENVRFDENVASRGGGAWNNKLSNGTFNNVVFKNNNSGAGGGGLWIVDSSPSLDGVMFVDNSVDEGEGGGLTVEGGAPFLSNVTFLENTAISGGGAYIDAPFAALDRVAFIRNSASDTGGGLRLEGSSPSLTGVTFLGNTAQDGGGIYSSGGSPTLINASFTGNSAQASGGGMLALGGSLDLHNPLFTGNTAALGGGLASAGDTSLTNATFSGNKALDSGGGLWIGAESNLSLENSIVWGNLAAANPQVSGFAEINNSLVAGLGDLAYTGENNLSEDPRFADADGMDGLFGTVDDDLSLQTNSPALDVGSNAALTEGITTDLVGSPRIVNGAVDMGAYELLKPVYVDDSAEGANTGASWKDAFTDLQDAFETATEENQIWVAGGTYTPSSGDRFASFQLRDGLRVYGGFVGNETSLQQRRWRQNETVLSGDVDRDGTLAGNSYAVVSALGGEGGGSAVLNGFVIEGGSGMPDDLLATVNGGGIVIEDFSPALSNLVLRGNRALFGGGLYVASPQPLTFENLTFVNNEALLGGGLYNAATDLALKNAVFVGNTAKYIENEIFPPEFFEIRGGGLFNSGQTVLMNVVFDGNAAENGYGGATATASGITPAKLAVINGTFAWNTASEGDSVSNEGGEVYLKNSILWEGPGEQSLVYGDGLTSFAYSLVQNSGGSGEGWNLGGAFDAGGNIDADPLFLDADGEDGIAGNLDDNLRLHFLSGYSGGFEELALAGDIIFNATSPAVDSGSGALLLPVMVTDLGGFPRIADDAVDMGAYENSNTSWLFAEPLPADGISRVYQYLSKENQSRWYKIPVKPDDLVTAVLQSVPEDYDLALMRDLAAEYEAAKAEIEREKAITPDAFTPDAFTPDAFTPDAFTPDAFTPDAFTPDAFTPDAFTPDAFTPDAFTPDAFTPDAFTPDAFTPDAFTPDAFTPDAFTPDAFTPDAFTPDAFTPDAFTPDAFTPDAFTPEGQSLMTTVQRRNVVDVSYNRGLASEEVMSYTWLDDGYYYIRVKGYEGASNGKSSFQLQVFITPGDCQDVEVEPEIPDLDLAEGSLETLILADFTRLPFAPDQMAVLNAFSAQVNGQVVDVSGIGNIAALNAQADEQFICPEAKNRVAGAIKEVVDQYRAKNPLEYLVILGSDDVVPFFRHYDNAAIGNEILYNPPVGFDTASLASLRKNYVLSQDDYGASAFIERTSRVNDRIVTETIAAPGLATGRLVETPAEITHMLELYLSSGGQVRLNSGLIAGYDFVVDSAEAARDTLAGGLATLDGSLIYTGEMASTAWDAADLKTGLETFQPQLVYLAGHFGANGLLSAQGNYTEDEPKSRLWTTAPDDNPWEQILDESLAATTANLENTLWMSLGCHSGYNVVDGDMTSEIIDGVETNISPDPDWAQFLASKGATWVGGTGFQYGNTDMLLYSERLYADLASTLRPVAPEGAVPVGKALTGAKNAYLCQLDSQEVGGTHTKALREMTLYGLPMMRFALTPTAPVDREPGEAPGVPGIPGANPLLGQKGVGFNGYTLQPRVVGDTSYYVIEGTDPCLVGSGAVIDQFSAEPGKPVLPKLQREITADGHVARGTLFLGGSYAEETARPYVSQVTFDEVLGEMASPASVTFAPQFYSPVNFPPSPWTINNFNAIATTADGRTFLSFMPVQHRSPQSGDLNLANRRKYDSADFQVFYMPLTAEGQQAMLYAAPVEIHKTSATKVPGGVLLEVQASGVGPSKAVQVVVAYTFGPDEQGAGAWESIALDQDPLDPTVWSRLIPLPDDGGEVIVNAIIPPADADSKLRYLVQAVSDTGLVTLVTNEGKYYGVEQDENRAGSTLSLQVENAGIIHPGDPIQLTATLTNGAPLAGMVVSITLDSQQLAGVTGADGSITMTFDGLLPGSYTARASFFGTDAYQPAEDRQDVLVSTQKRATNLQLAPPLNNDMTVTALLTDAETGDPLAFKTILLAAGQQVYLRETDASGLARFVLPAGTYPLISASFGKPPFDDPYYEPSEGALANVTILPVQATLAYTGDTAVKVGDPVRLAAQVGYQSPSTLSFLYARVRFEVRKLNGDLLHEVEVRARADGSASAEIPSPAVGVYRIVVKLAGGYFTADPAYAMLAVYDPQGGRATGGGWVTPANSSTKVHFTFNPRYVKGSGVPSGSVEVRLDGKVFRSDALEYLVVASPLMQVKGTGTINGSGRYGFIVTGIDGALPGGRVDRIRIKIWSLDTGSVVFDNQPGSPDASEPTMYLAGGDITLHK